MSHFHRSSFFMSYFQGYVAVGIGYFFRYFSSTVWWLKGDSSGSQGHEKCKTDIVRASGLGVLDLLSINEKKEVKVPAECNKSARCPLRCNHKDKLFASTREEEGLRRLDEKRQEEGKRLF